MWKILKTLLMYCALLCFFKAGQAYSNSLVEGRERKSICMTAFGSTLGELSTKKAEDLLLSYFFMRIKGFIDRGGLSLSLPEFSLVFTRSEVLTPPSMLPPVFSFISGEVDGFYKSSLALPFLNTQKTLDAFIRSVRDIVEFSLASQADNFDELDKDRKRYLIESIIWNIFVLDAFNLSLKNPSLSYKKRSQYIRDRDDADKRFMDAPLVSHFLEDISKLASEEVLGELNTFKERYLAKKSELREPRKDRISYSPN